MLAQPVEVKPVIVIGIKARLTVVATLDDVYRDVGQGQAATAGHGRGSAMYDKSSIALNRGLSPIITLRALLPPVFDLHTIYIKKC